MYSHVASCRPAVRRRCAGVIETTRPDAKNAQYLAVVKTGDALLNKVQGLARLVSV